MKTAGNPIQSPICCRPVRRIRHYTDPGFANAYLTDPKVADYRLWIADYGVETPTIPHAWQGKVWTFWQHTQTGEATGVTGHVDLDVFNGTQEEFLALVQDAKAP